MTCFILNTNHTTMREECPTQLREYYLNDQVFISKTLFEYIYIFFKSNSCWKVWTDQSEKCSVCLHITILLAFYQTHRCPPCPWQRWSYETPLGQHREKICWGCPRCWAEGWRRRWEPRRGALLASGSARRNAADARKEEQAREREGVRWSDLFFFGQAQKLRGLRKTKNCSYFGRGLEKLLHIKKKHGKN